MEILYVHSTEIPYVTVVVMEMVMRKYHIIINILMTTVALLLIQFPTVAVYESSYFL